ncbi:MAG: DASS family sodium-coupled anion symporter [Rhodocyclaceae bacterium]|nr:DASS family sodium-coupled anion symporter [Rhodocyclaceae bacterium]MBR4737850.1 DASS family sodium-coupled anion symporter [Rhodocyclaceae bacterium]
MQENSRLQEEHIAPLEASEKDNPFPLRGLLIILVAALVAIGFYHLLGDWLPDSDIVNASTRKGLALLLFIAALWLTEAVHISVTSLIVPISALLVGITKNTYDKSDAGELLAITAAKVLTIKEVMAPFADPIIYTFFGGFALATALHIQKLDKKIALWLISLSGNRLGVSAILICLATALLSMWVSNTATAAMMLPLALGILANINMEKDRNTVVFILLGIAYSASIGGLGTLVGSPPNAIASKALGYEFADWMKVGLPIMCILLPLMLLCMYAVFRPNLAQKIEVQTEAIPWNRTRIMTAIVFLCAALLWCFTKPLNELFKEHGFPLRLSDAFVAVSAAIAIVTLGLSKWKDIAENTEWGVLILFGGGLTLSMILDNSGAAYVLGKTFAGVFADIPTWLLMVLVSVFVIAITEFTSNTASAALLVPVFGAIAAQMGLPKETLIIIIGIGASCAFVMPVATPPNAIVFGTGQIRQMEMVKCGLILAILSAIVLGSYIYLAYPA